MAIGRTSRGQGTHNVSSTSFTLSPSGNFAAGSWGVICVAADNSSSGGSTNNISNVTDSLGNTWTVRRATVYDPGAANAGVQLSIWTTDQAVGTLTTGTVITVSFGAATIAKTWALHEATKGATEAISYVTGADDPGAATAAPTLTTVSITSGDLIIAAYGVEAGTTQTGTGDADTTNGTWSTAQYAEIGSTTSGSVIISQGKVVTATATQTYNPTLGISSDTVGAYVVLHAEVPIVSVSPALLGGGSSFALTVLPGGVSVSPKTIGGVAFDGEAFDVLSFDAKPYAFAPTVQANTTISVPLIGPTGVVLEPAPFQFIILIEPIIASGVAHAPTVNQTTAPAVLGGGSVFAFVLSISAPPRTVDIPIIDRGTFDPDAFDPLSFGDWWILAPTVTAGPVSVSVPLLGGSTLFAPSVGIAQTVTVNAVITQVGVTFAPTMTISGVAVSPDLLGGYTLFAPGNVPGGISLTLNRIDQTGVTFAPVLTAAGIGVQAPLIDQAAVLYGMSVLPGTVTVIPSRLGGGLTFSPQVNLAGFVPPTIVNLGLTFPPSISGGLIQVAGLAPVAIATNLRPSGTATDLVPVGSATHSKPER